MKILKLMMVSTLLLVLPALNGWGGDIEGSVTVKGLRTAENVLVYLSKAPQVEMDLKDAEFVMDQRNLTFHPNVLPVPVGAAVRFPNNDKVDHNVFSLSRTKGFNLGSYKPGESKTITFDKPGVVELRCDVHAEMLAYIIVMKNPYFSLTDKMGAFRIPDPHYAKAHNLSSPPELPAGRYSVKTRHAKLKTRKQTVLIPATGELKVDLPLGRGRPGALYKR